MQLNVSKKLDQLLPLTHPDREIQFVFWSTRNILNIDFFSEMKTSTAGLNKFERQHNSSKYNFKSS